MDEIMFEIKTEAEEHILPDSVSMKSKSKVDESENLDDNFKVEITFEEHQLNTFGQNEVNNEKADPLKIPSNAHNIRISENSNSFQCVFCMKYLVSSEKLHEHMNMYHPQENVDIQDAGSTQSLECKYCFKECANLGGLKNHIRMLHKDEKEVMEPEPKEQPKCDICNRNFKRIYELLRHKNSVHKNRTFQFTCKFCKSIFDTSSSLTEHIVKFHSEINQDNINNDKSDNVNYSDHPWKKFECRYCYKECANSCGLKNHLRKVHKGEKDITELKPKEKPKCEICDRTFTRIYELIRHMRTQHDCKPLKCTICMEVFSSDNSLTVHMEKCHGHQDTRNITESEEKENSIVAEKDSDNVHELEEEDDSNDTEKDKNDIHQTEENHDIINNDDNQIPNTSVESRSSFKCKYCFRQCANLCGLKNHLRTVHKNENGLKELESGERPKCNICGRSFIQNHELTRHMSTHNKGKFLKCEFCATTFLTEKNLANHIEKVHGIRVENLNFARCKICGVTYMDEKLLEDHLLKKPFSCSICCKHFSSELTYRMHNKKHHEGSYFKCRLCDKSYQQVEILKAHLQSQHGGVSTTKSHKSENDSELEPPIKLAKTDKSENANAKHRSMKAENKLEGHNLENKSKEKVDSGLDCDVCLETFDTWDDLEKHKLTSSKFACKICHKHFQRSLTLSEHMNTHSKEKIFQCEYCIRTFFMKGSLRTHIRTQHPTKVEIQDSRIKLFFCDDFTCDQKFPLYRDLVIHMRQHKGTKPYKCDQCERQFSVSAHLDTHKKRRHENVKPYNCDVCQKPFYRKKFMLKHFNKHTLKKKS